MRLRLLLALMVLVGLVACSSSDHETKTLCGYAKLCCINLGVEETAVSDCNVFDDQSFDECKAYLDEKGQAFRLDDQARGLPPRSPAHPRHCYTSLGPLPDATP